MATSIRRERRQVNENDSHLSKAAFFKRMRKQRLGK